jgi:hypothetical protein
MAAATVPTPTAAVGGQNYYIGQSFNYGGQAYTPVYDQSGKRIGYRNQAGAMIDPNPTLDGLSAPTITPTGAATPAQAAAANTGTTPSAGGGNPTITYGGGNLPDAATAQAFWRQQAIASGDQNPGQIDAATALQYWQNTHPQAPGPSVMPEQVALSQLQQIDPTSEALRANLGQSYLNTLNQAPMPTAPTFAGGQAPAAGDVQNYLDLYKQIDPAGYAQRQGMAQQVSDYVTKVTGQAPSSAQDALAKYSQLDPQGYAQLGQLGGAMGSYLSSAQQQAALGTQLDPQTIREITQATRLGQQARGNVYGTPQLVAEAMTRGQAGMAIQQQRQAALGQAGQAMQSYLTSGAMPGTFGQQLYQQGLANQQGALGTQQSWLSSDQSLGDIANTLYQQGYARNLVNYQQQLGAYQTQLGARQAAQSGALGYLGSGQTPYQAGASYVDRAQQAAADAAQGGASYNPSQIGQTYQAAQLPQYGLDIGAQATNWYNSMVSQSANQAAYGQTGTSGGSKAMSAGVGALGGAASGALAGSAIPGVGTLVGAGVGALTGAAKGYFS